MDKLATQQLATMRVDGKTVELPRATAGLGYVKTMVDATSPTTFAIEKTSAGTSWGALYAQYWQKASEVEAYCLERGNGIDPVAFVDFYEAKGWCVGKTPMKDWKAAVRTWEHERREKRAMQEQAYAMPLN